MRGLARWVDRQSLATLAAVAVEAFEDSPVRAGCGSSRGCCGFDDPASLPDGWERLETSWREALGTLPEGFEVGPSDQVHWTRSGQSASPGDATAVLLSVNTVNFFEYELTATDPVPTRRYGPLAPLVTDLGALGVGVVRHPGRVQLMLDEVLVDHMVPVSPTEMAVPFDLADAAALDMAVQRSPVLSRVLDLASELRSQNVELQLIITMLSLGGGSTTVAGVTLSIDDDGDGVDTTYSQAIPLRWASDWVGQAVYDDLADTDQPFDRSTVEGEPLPGPWEDTWDARSMDPRNPAKRAFYRNFARSLGRWLAAHESELADVLAGIEICNEAEIRHVILSGGVQTPDGAGWGALYYYCASAIREECDWVPLWLPGIASYAPDETDGCLSWQGKVDFLRQMLTEIEGQRAADLVLDAHGAARPRFERWELVDGLDYHWYHRAQSAKVEPKDPGDRQLLLWLPLELAELRKRLDEQLFTEVILSVTETAVNVLCHESAAGRTWAADYPAGCEDRSVAAGGPAPDYRPLYVECPAGRPLSAGVEAPANAFQGAMVWMRVLASLVGGARIAGWHTHVARQPSSSFAGTGLRQDLHGTDAGIENAGARVSWYALRQLAALLDTVTAVRLAWPGLPEDREEFKRLLGAGEWSSDNLVWVVELENVTHAFLSRRGGTVPLGWIATGLWGYVLFIDGTPGAKDPLPVPTCATVSLRADLGTDVHRVAVAPHSLVSGPGDADAFPSEAWIAGLSETLDRSGRYSGVVDRYDLRVALGQWPILLLSTSPLAVGGVRVGGTTP